MEVEIFTDETYFENWRYIGIICLFIPIKYKEDFVKKLVNLRCYNGNWSWCYNNCVNVNKCNEHNHDMNNSEIHFKELNKASHNKKVICKKWLDLLMKYNQNKDSDDDLIYFKILYLDLEKIDESQFGVNSDKNNIYNRFYRSIIIGARKFFFTDKYFVIKEFFHDQASDKENHDLFPWHTPTRLNNSRDFNILNEEIRFIDSNHRNYDNVDDMINSQLIQFADLILGSVTEAIFHKADNKNKIELSNQIFELVKRLWTNPKNVNSHFNYYRKMDVSIFPKDKIMFQEDLFNELKHVEGQFHRRLPIRERRDYESETGPLDKYFSLD